MIRFGEFRSVCGKLFPGARQFSDRAGGRRAGMARTAYSAQIRVGERLFKLVLSMSNDGRGDIELRTEPLELKHEFVSGGPNEQLVAYAAALKTHYGVTSAPASAPIRSDKPSGAIT